MRVTIVLPSFPNLPSGGHRALYEHANGMAARGHQVTLIHPRTAHSSASVADRLKARLWPAKVRWTSGGSPNWFPLQPDVRIQLTRALDRTRMPDADIIVASAWRTAGIVATQPPEKGIKFYFVQDYEYWATAKPSMRATIGQTFSLGLRHIATSGVVEEMLGEYGVRPDLRVTYGLDQETFRVTTALEDRQVGSIGFPLRRERFKGTDDAIEAVRTLRTRFGEALRVHCFGSHRPPSLPDWITTEVCRSDDDLRRYYNSISIFILPSHFEGFGLPGTEAMACGAALVAADSGGVRDYVVDGKNAILVPSGRPDLLVDGVADLIADDAKRRAVALRGSETMASFRWESSTKALEREFAVALDSSRRGGT